MAKANHTPGPWVTWQDGIRSPSGEKIATVHAVRDDDEQSDNGKRRGEFTSDANARLIAAAPSLVAALDAVIWQAKHMRVFDSDPCIQEAIRVVAEARGTNRAPNP